MPEQDGLVVALAAGLQAGDDLAELGMQRLPRDSLPASTWARSEPNLPPLHWPQSSTTILAMMSVSDSSTALIVP